jgi:hypothetical protein
LKSAGRLQDQTLMQWDVQLGYWLLLPGKRSGVLQGLAPFVELHYGTTLNDADSVQSGGFVIGSLANRTDELNISAGIGTRLWNNLALMIGAAAPLRLEDDQAFEYQVGVRASWFFGASAAQPTPATYVSAY